jgi:hypothetical protein
LSNVEKLVTAGVVTHESLSPDDKKFLESLTGAEVDTLIAIKGKIGEFPDKFGHGYVVDKLI